MIEMTLMLGLWGVINLVTFAIYGLDKYKARHHKWRISEATLLLLAAVGGSAGALVAMQVFRHKTQHLKFKLGVPALLVLQLACVYVWGK